MKANPSPISLATLRLHAWAAALVLAGALAAAGRAQADTQFFEAEGGGNNNHPLSNSDAKITSPMLIKDDSAASMGRYLTVAPGNNAPTTPPPVEGVASYRFGVTNAGNYRIWGRVQALSLTDDSFWVRLKNITTGTSTLVRWNDIPLGSTWHWALVVADGMTAPQQFALVPTDQYELQISYREDGAKLDTFVITDDTTFNPKTPPTTAPPLPTPTTSDWPFAVPRRLVAGAKTGIKLFWSEVPGAKSYTVRHANEGGTLPDVKGITTHVFTETRLPPAGVSNCYDVVAIFPDGSFTTIADPAAVCQDLKYEQTFIDTSSAITAAAPMVLDDVNNGAFTAAGTPSSNAAPPAHGRLSLDFAVGGAAKLRLRFVVGAPDTAHDSFWARMDQGTWIKWNNIPSGCSQVSNSDAGGAAVTFSVAAGTHRFELATRETGTVAGNQEPSLSNIFFITDDLSGNAKICDD